MPRIKDSDRHIVDGIADLLEGAGGLARVRRLQSGALSFDREVWGKLAALGWLGAAVPERQGGTGLELREIALLLEQAGRRLMPEPLVPVLAASVILARCGAPAAPLLADLIAGKTLCVPVDAEGAYLFDGHAADSFVTVVEDGICVLPRGMPGLAVDSEETLDGGSIARLRFAGINALAPTVLGKGPEAMAAFRDARDLMRLGYAALLTGLMDELLAMTVAYLKERRQFGVPIGSFQALQHRAASLYVGIGAARALLFEACKAAGTARQGVAALAAKAQAAEMAMQTVKECVQMHGAMGYTDEHNMSLFFRRAMAMAPAGGDALACRKLLYAERETIRDL